VRTRQWIVGVLLTFTFQSAALLSLEGHVMSDAGWFGSWFASWFSGQPKPLPLIINEEGQHELVDTTPATIKIATENFNFNNSIDGDKADIKMLTNLVDIVAGQEFKDRNAAHLFPRTWRTRQDTTTSARAGTFIAWDYAKCWGEQGGLFLGVDPHNHPEIGSRIQTRYVRWQTLRIRHTTKSVTVVSLHMPPGSDRELSPFMADNIVKWGKRHMDENLVLAGDWNSLIMHDPWNIGQRLGLRPYGSKIDGFLTNMKALNIRPIDVRSDHPAIIGEFIPK